MAQKINKFFANRNTLIAVGVAILCLVLVGILIIFNMTKGKDEVTKSNTQSQNTINTSNSVNTTANDSDGVKQPAAPTDPDVAPLIPTN